MIGAEGYYYHNDKWPNLNEYLEVSSTPEGFLKQFELKIEDPKFILGRLNNMDINRYNLMPTYDHIALDIINRYKSS